MTDDFAARIARIEARHARTRPAATPPRRLAAHRPPVPAARGPGAALGAPRLVLCAALLLGLPLLAGGAAVLHGQLALTQDTLAGALPAPADLRQHAHAPLKTAPGMP